MKRIQLFLYLVLEQSPQAWLFYSVNFSTLSKSYPNQVFQMSQQRDAYTWMQLMQILVSCRQNEDKQSDMTLSDTTYKSWQRHICSILILTWKKGRNTVLKELLLLTNNLQSNPENLFFLSLKVMEVNPWKQC